MFHLHLTKWMPAAVLVAAMVFTMTENSDAQETITTSSGLQYIEHEVGSGDAAKAGDNVAVHYTGWLYKDGEKGPKFDSSVDRGQPFTFPLGAGRVIKCWDEGVAGMQPGGERTLILKPALAYGASGAGGVIPPNATLMFDVELIEVQ